MDALRPDARLGRLRLQFGLLVRVAGCRFDHQHPSGLSAGGGGQRHRAVGPPIQPGTRRILSDPDPGIMDSSEVGQTLSGSLQERVVSNLKLAVYYSHNRLRRANRPSGTILNPANRLNFTMPSYRLFLKWICQED